MKKLILSEYTYLKELFLNKWVVTSVVGLSNSRKLALIISVYLIIELIISMVTIYPIDYFFPQIGNSYSTFDDLSKIELFILAVLIAPPIEELLFRLPLKHKVRNIQIWTFSIMLISLYIHYALSLVLLICFMYLLREGSKRSFNFKLKSIYKRNGTIIFWLSVVAFAAMHIDNFDLDLLPLYLWPVAIIPQFIGGIALAIVRLRFGFLWAILYHAAFNLTVSIASLI